MIDEFQSSGTSPTEFSLSPDDITEVRENFFRIGLCLHDTPSSANCPPGSRCYCYDCVEQRNTPALGELTQAEIKTNQFREDMLRAGFNDAEQVDFREYIDLNFYEDVKFILNRISSIGIRTPHKEITHIENTQFRKSIHELQKQKRTHPAAVLRGGVFSTRVKTEWAENQRKPEPFITRHIPYNGDVVSVRHQPNQVCVDIIRALDKPSYDGDTRLTIDANLFKSKFTPNPLKRLPGERIREEFFEPSSNEVGRWIEKYTRDGRFKPKSYTGMLFSVRRPNWELSDHQDEAPASRHITADRWTSLFERFSDTDFDTAESGVYQNIEAHDSLEIAATDFNEDEGNPYRIAAPKFASGAPWSFDPNFVREITNEFPAQKLRAYIGKVPQRLLFPEIEKLVRIPKIVTPFESDNWEHVLKSAEDYSPEQHKYLAHLYEYGYRYYPSEPRDIRVQEVWNTVRNTKSDKSKPKQESWDDAIRDTFGKMDQLPPDGFYTRVKLSKHTPTRVYLVLPNPNMNLVESDGDVIELDSEYHESPAPMGLTDIYQELRDQAEQTRSRKAVKTVRRSLRAGFHRGVAHIRFQLKDGRLAWVVTP